jgi:MoxR-like ATPase
MKFTTEQKQLISNIEAFIPEGGRQFYETELSGMKSFDLIDTAIGKQINIKLQGPTGCGKTTIYESYCEAKRIPHFVSNMKGSTTSEELVGAFVPNDNDEGGAPYVWKDGVIVRAIKYSNLYIEVDVSIGKNEDGEEIVIWDKEEGQDHYRLDIGKDGMVVESDVISKTGKKLKVKAYPQVMLTIEEINFSPEELMSVWFSLLDARRNIVLNEKNGEVLKAGKFLTVNATMNPDYIGTNSLNEALNDRFLIKLNVEYDIKVENKIISRKAKEMEMFVQEVQFLKKFIHLIRKGKTEQELQGNLSTRMIEAYLDIKGNFGDDVAKSSLLNAFSDEDVDFVKEAFDLAFSETHTVDMSSEEMEGLDLQNFKGYKPPKSTKKTPKKKSGSAIPAPF